MRPSILILSLLLIHAAFALAAAPEHAPAAAAAAAATAHAATTDGHAAAQRPYTHPVLPEPSVLPGVTLIIVLAMFLLAVVIGPVVRYHAPEEVPDASSHDEHGPGAHDAAHDAHAHGH